MRPIEWHHQCAICQSQKSTNRRRKGRIAGDGDDSIITIACDSSFAPAICTLLWLTYGALISILIIIIIIIIITVAVVTSNRVEVLSIVNSMSVCLSVCLSVQSYTSNNKLSYRRGTAQCATLVNSCYVLWGMEARKVSNSKSDLQGHWWWCHSIAVVWVEYSCRQWQPPSLTAQQHDVDTCCQPNMPVQCCLLIIFFCSL